MNKGTEHGKRFEKQETTRSIKKLFAACAACEE
jgi:hypothetical protein